MYIILNIITKLLGLYCVCVLGWGREWGSSMYVRMYDLLHCARTDLSVNMCAGLGLLWDDRRRGSFFIPFFVFYEGRGRGGSCFVGVVAST